MNTKDIKTDLIKKLNALKDDKLEEAYGILLNYINGTSENDDWKSLSFEQQEALKKGIDQLNKGEGKSHFDVMRDIKSRYGKE